MESTHLNTNVNGNSGTCVEAADWLMLAEGRADTAAEQGHKARNEVRSSWRGSAFQAFHERTNGPVWNLEDLAHTARTYESAARDFAGSLDTVNRHMNEAISTATGGGLEVQGPIIMRPKHPGRPPAVPDGVLSVSEADAAYGSYRNEMDSYMPKLSEYNAQVGTYNTCREIVREARNVEKQAHVDLRESLEPEDKGMDGWAIGTTTASSIADYLSTGESMRAEALGHAERLAKESRTFQMVAMGRAHELTSKQIAQYKMAAMKASAQEQVYVKRVSDLERFMNVVGPDKLRSTNPSKALLRQWPRVSSQGNVKVCDLGVKSAPGVLCGRRVRA